MPSYSVVSIPSVRFSLGTFSVLTVATGWFSLIVVVSVISSFAVVITVSSPVETDSPTGLITVVSVTWVTVVVAVVVGMNSSVPLTVVPLEQEKNLKFYSYWENRNTIESIWTGFSFIGYLLSIWMITTFISIFIFWIGQFSFVDDSTILLYLRNTLKFEVSTIIFNLNKINLLYLDHCLYLHQQDDRHPWYHQE